MKEGETIKIVSHSQGGAHANGFAEKLMTYRDEDTGKPIYNIEVIYYITPHQPDDMKAPDGVRTVQYSHPGDKVSSDAPAAMPNGGSKYAKIEGVDEFYGSDIMGLPGAPPCGGSWNGVGNRCGHNVEDNIDYIKSTQSVKRRGDTDVQDYSSTESNE